MSHNPYIPHPERLSRKEPLVPLGWHRNTQVYTVFFADLYQEPQVFTVVETFKSSQPDGVFDDGLVFLRSDEVSDTPEWVSFTIDGIKTSINRNIIAKVITYVKTEAELDEDEIKQLEDELEKRNG